FSSRRRHTRFSRDWSSDVCSSDLILPHIYKGKALAHSHIIDKIANYPFEKNKGLIVCTLILVIVSLFTYSKVAFDGDLSKINFVPKEQQLAEKELYADHQVAKNLFVVAFDEDQEKALQLNSGIHKKLSAFSTVDNLQTISSLIPSKILQNKAINRWKSFWTDEKLNNAIKSIEEESVKT